MAQQEMSVVVNYSQGDDEHTRRIAAIIQEAVELHPPTFVAKSVAKKICDRLAHHNLKGVVLVGPFNNAESAGAISTGIYNVNLNGAVHELWVGLFE